MRTHFKIIPALLLTLNLASTAIVYSSTDTLTCLLSDNSRPSSREPPLDANIIDISVADYTMSKNIWQSYRHNPRWAAVDEYALKQTHPPSRPNTRPLQHALSLSSEAGLPDYSLPACHAKFLALHCRTASVRHALEVGTLGGYTAIWLASENPQMTVTTIEQDFRNVVVARQNIKLAGLSDSIEVVHGSGIDVLTKLRDEVRQGLRPRFGFTFIDADKVNNWNYLKLAKDMMEPKSVICIDNIVRDGFLADLDTRDPYILGCREVVEKAAQEPGLDSVVLQTVGEKGYDGWLWAVVDSP